MKGPQRIGLTGGIGAGKSTAATVLARLGAKVIDHDELARAALAPGTPGAGAVLQAFDTAVLVTGEIDRAALARIVFADQGARAHLEGIVHPLVDAQARAADAAAFAANPQAVVVHEIPLLVETGGRDWFDQVLVVYAPLAIRLARLQQRGLTQTEACNRIAAQASDDERNANASYIFDGGGAVSALQDQLTTWWESR